MPLYLLLPHLVRKAWMKRFGEEQKVPEIEDKRTVKNV
jgi:hypothetical protein